MSNEQKLEKQSKKKEGAIMFDMYHLFSRWDVLLAVAFIIAFLVFTVAIFMYPQVV